MSLESGPRAELVIQHTLRLEGEDMRVKKSKAGVLRAQRTKRFKDRLQSKGLRGHVRWGSEIVSGLECG